LLMLDGTGETGVAEAARLFAAMAAGKAAARSSAKLFDSVAAASIAETTTGILGTLCMDMVVAVVAVPLSLWLLGEYWTNGDALGLAAASPGVTGSEIGIIRAPRLALAPSPWGWS
jgi:hypothetical protein